MFVSSSIHSRSYTVICEDFAIKKLSRTKYLKIVVQFFFTSNTIIYIIVYSGYMARVWYEQKYCYMKISNSKILLTKLMWITVAYTGGHGMSNTCTIRIYPFCSIKYLVY